MIINLIDTEITTAKKYMVIVENKKYLRIETTVTSQQRVEEKTINWFWTLKSLNEVMYEFDWNILPPSKSMEFEKQFISEST